MSRRAIFLDRDGVINSNRPDHVKAWEEFEFLPQTREALRRIAPSDLAVVVVTNQAAIHRNMVDEATVRTIHDKMLAQVQEAGGRIDAVYFCPHLPEEKCGCRKPQPGMYLRAEAELDLDLPRSYVVGDARGDMEAAHNIGAQPILVLTGRDCEKRSDALEVCTACAVDCVVLPDLKSAVDWICAKEDAGK